MNLPSQYLEKFQPRAGPDSKPNVQWEFQSICLEMMKVFGEKEKKRIWSMPYQKWFTEEKGWRALEIMKKRGVNSINYYQGIINKI